MAEIVHLPAVAKRLEEVQKENETLGLKSGDGDGTSGGMDTRLAKLESTFEGFKAVPSLAFTVVSIAMGELAIAITIGIFTINNMSSRIDALSGRVEGLNARFDGVSRQLADEFRAMRAETAAQTSAIANSITAARQVQPQIVVMPPAQPPALPRTPQPGR